MSIGMVALSKVVPVVVLTPFQVLGSSLARPYNLSILLGPVLGLDLSEEDKKFVGWPPQFNV